VSRTLTPAILAEISAAVIRPALLLALDTTGGYVYFWTGLGNLVWDGDTYVGAGELAGISEIRESTDLEAAGLSFHLSGVPSALVAVALGSIRQGLAAELRLAFLDASLAVIANPILLWEGFTDVPEISEDGQTATISISSEHRLVDLERPRSRRYTDQDQKIDAPTDLGFEFVPGLQDKQILWGR